MDFYSSHLKIFEQLRPFFQEMARRRIVLRRTLVSIVAGSLAVSLAIAAVAASGEKANRKWLLLSPIPALAALVIAQKSSQRFRDNYKHSVFSAAVNATYPTLRWSDNGFLPQQIYNQCDLFERRPDLYGGENLLFGTMGGIKVGFSQIESYGRQKDRSGKIFHQPLFRGVLFQAEFSRPQHAVTTLLPPQRVAPAQVLRPLMGQKRERLPLGDGIFEQSFHVYSSDPDESMAILSVPFMDRLVAMQHHFKGQQLKLSFIGNRVTLAVGFAPGSTGINASLWTGPGDMDNFHFFVHLVSGFSMLLDGMKKSKVFWTKTASAFDQAG